MNSRMLLAFAEVLDSLILKRNGVMAALEAIEAYRQSLQFVNLELTVQKLGTAFFEAGRVKEAISEFQEGVGMSPQNASMRFSLAVALLKDGNKKSALSEFKKAADLAPKSEVARKANDYIKTLR